jgi:hypothetical protein
VREAYHLKETSVPLHKSSLLILHYKEDRALVAVPVAVAVAVAVPVAVPSLIVPVAAPVAVPVAVAVPPTLREKAQKDIL